MPNRRRMRAGRANCLASLGLAGSRFASLSGNWERSIR